VFEDLRRKLRRRMPSSNGSKWQKNKTLEEDKEPPRSCQGVERRGAEEENKEP